MAGSEEITSVDVAWGPMTNGKPSTVLVYQDPNNDGDPSDAVLLTTADTTVANAGTDTFTSVPISPVTVSGKFFVGVLVRNLGCERRPRPDRHRQFGRALLDRRQSHAGWFGYQ